MDNDISVLKHSLQHVMVLAVRRLFGFDIQLGVGPVIDNGFYQDFQYSLTPEQFPLIEEEMSKIVAEDIEISMKLMSVNEAIDYFSQEKQPYKVELLNDIKMHGTSRADKNIQEESSDVALRTEEGKVSIYSFADHIDLCRGPHVSRTGELASLQFK
jgi:threonyl-tRNA synthetase